MKLLFNKTTVSVLLTVIVFSAFLSGCAKTNTGNNTNKTYTATAAGYGGDVTVEVALTEDGKIGNIKVDAPKETPELGGAAAPKVAEAIVSKQSLTVDTISGATVTSEAVIKAAEEALKKGGVDTEALK
ncbi:FMN-binding protein [Anaerocolumna cellulosilytica]|uniref:FMN-binding protein n=1 Tax=Anaerocolumna cellulosilytica TaxID=433286 RepID=A0A6S6R3Y2_9FIRM|nr:FMN-binding protein [Anaerocolumna cellulosilytica]MBB5195517.1 fumarate reductase flavoprotein subunit [Anaerocolumna cellulosilytica]BCJ93758.1 FMN-binding protein [Anaerocolumna cellulosilytica]